jgi:hypothetical protein
MVLLPLGMAAVAVLPAGGRGARSPCADRHRALGMATAGYRELQGQAGGRWQLLVAPLTGAPCCWCGARREVDAVDDLEEIRLETVRSVTSSAPLLVRDTTGVCAVHVDGAEVTPTDRSQWTGATLEPEDRNPPRHGVADSPTGMLQIAGTSTSLYRYRPASMPVIRCSWRAAYNRRFEARDDDERGTGRYRRRLWPRPRRGPGPISCAATPSRRVWRR